MPGSSDSDRTHLLGWIVGLSSLAAIMTVLYVGYNISALRRDLGLTAALRAELEQGVPADRIFAAEQYEPLLGGANSLRRNSIQKAFSLKAGIAAGEIESALRLADSPALASYDSSRKLADSLASLAAADKAAADLAPEFSELEKDEDAALSLYEATRTEAARAVTLPEGALGETPEAVEDLSFYSAGILAGLPLLGRLPDGLNDAKSLAAALQVLGGKFSASALPQVMSNELDRLRRQAASVRENADRLTRRRSELEQSEDIITERKQAAQNKAVEAVDRLILRLAAPAENRGRADLYRRVDTLLRTFGSGLPELPENLE